MYYLPFRLSLFFVLLLVYNTPVSAQSINKMSPPQREDAYRANNFGAAQLEQFDYKAGAESFRRALALDPQLKIAQINLAIALFNLQDIDAALPGAQTAAKNSPDSPQPFYILGLIAKNQNRTDDAVAFKRVLEIDPNDVGANVNLGQIYAQQRKYTEAVTVFRTAITAEPYNATALYNLATALLRNNAREEGQQLMTRFQTLRQTGAATSIGQNYLEQGRYAEAIVSTGAENELVDKTEPKVTFQETNIGLHSARPKQLPMFYDAVLFDADNDDDLDIALTNPAKIYRNEQGKFVDATAVSGDYAKAQIDVGSRIVAGDFDNDNLTDLFVARGKNDCGELR